MLIWVSGRRPLLASRPHGVNHAIPLTPETPNTFACFQVRHCMPSGQAEVGATCLQVRRINLYMAFALLINSVNLKRNAAMLEINPRDRVVKHRLSSFLHNAVDDRVPRPPYF